MSSEKNREKSELSLFMQETAHMTDSEKSEKSEITPATLYASLLSRGLRVTVDGDRLRVTPSGQLTEQDRAAIVQHKPVLIALIRSLEPEPFLDLAWFAWPDPVPVPVHELTPAQLHALAHCGKRYEVEPTPRHLLFPSSAGPEAA